jgi:hypothetical protein
MGAVLPMNQRRASIVARPVETRPVEKGANKVTSVRAVGEEPRVNSTRRHGALDSSPFEITHVGPFGGVSGGSFLASESDRTKLIGELSRLVREPLMPESMRSAGLTLIGWLARRMPGEPAHALGVSEAQQESERRLRTARKAAR